MKIFKLKTKNSQNGYAVLELLFYIAFFTVFCLLVINAIIMMTRSFRETTIQTEFAESGGAIMERMSREIRQANSIDAASTSTDLKLNTTNAGGSPKTIEFKFTSSNIELWDAGANVGNLNSQNIVVTALTFTQITTTNGKAVKIFLTIRSSHDALNRTVDFYDTVGLRGSY